MPETVPAAPLLKNPKDVGPAELHRSALGIFDAPEFWLGQIAAVAELEAGNRLTRTEGMKAVQQVLANMRKQDSDRRRLVIITSQKSK